MAQVYSFTDQNGETRLFAEIHPDPAGTPFNGGTTLTDAPTVMSPSDKDAVALQLKPVTGATADQTDLLEIYDDAGNLLGYWDASGGFYSSGNNAQFALKTGKSFSLVDNSLADLLRVTAANTFGFYGHAAVAQQTLTSGTATPEQIALALQSNGLCGGS
jgi:hypothetical protein